MLESVGSLYVRQTAGNGYDSGWIALARESTVFEVLGCYPARIWLSVDPDAKSNSAYCVTFTATELTIQVPVTHAARTSMYTMYSAHII